MIKILDLDKGVVSADGVLIETTDVDYIDINLIKQILKADGALMDYLRGHDCKIGDVIDAMAQHFYVSDDDYQLSEIH